MPADTPVTRILLPCRSIPARTSSVVEVAPNNFVISFSLAAHYVEYRVGGASRHVQASNQRICSRSAINASLDDIAKEAGVGPGTLYRHFPTREELLEAVYRTEMEKLAAAEQKFAEELPPIEALRAWLLLFVDYIAAKQLIAPALNALL
jgi:hypothetical protein